MSEQQTNPNSSDAAESARAAEVQADGTKAAGASETKADESTASTASANDATPRDASSDTSRPANIVLYSPARANAEAERAAAEAQADAFKARAKWASRKVSRIVAVAAIAAAIGSLSGALATLGVAHVLQRSAPAVATADETGVIKAALLQLETQLAAMKVNVDHATKISAKIGERFDGFGGRIEFDGKNFRPMRTQRSRGSPRCRTRFASPRHPRRGRLLPRRPRRRPPRRMSRCRNRRRRACPQDRLRSCRRSLKRPDRLQAVQAR